MSDKYFRVDVKENSGDNWPIADFGVDEDGKHYILTTNNVRASNYPDVSKGAKGDAELCAELLNAYYNNNFKLVW